MKRFFNRRPILFLVIALVVVGIIIGIFSFIKGTSVVENAGGTVATPAQGAADGIAGWFSEITGYFGNVKALKSEIEALKAENTNLKKQVNDMEGLDEQNIRLRTMLDLKKKQTSLDMVAARVIARDPSSWYSCFTIDKGSIDGIKENMAVVDANRYLVGQILRVGENWADVLTVTDPSISVGAFVRRSNEIGIVEGDSNLRYDFRSKFGFIARTADIKDGDYVETSGLGGVFPRGLLIGTLADIHDESSTMSKVASVVPLCDFSKINEVFVITSYKETDLSEKITDNSDEDSKSKSDSTLDYDSDDDDEED